MPLNKSQIEHAVSRIRQAQNEKIDSIASEFGWPAITLTIDEKWDLVKKGKVSVNKDIRIKGYTRWSEIFDFSPFESESGISEEGEKKIKEVGRQAEEAIDQIKLGDAQEALKIIKDFRGGIS